MVEEKNSKIEDVLRSDALCHFELAALDKIRYGEHILITDGRANPYLKKMADKGLLEGGPHTELKGYSQYIVTQKGVDFLQELQQKQHEVSYDAWSRVFGSDSE